MLRPNHTSTLTLVALLATSLGTLPLAAGPFIGASDSQLELILHPQNYTGIENLVEVEVCIDPATLVPAGAVITDIEQSVINNVAIWNARQPFLGNVILGGSNDIPGNAIDFESVSVHEIGHCIGLAHVNAASESGLDGDDREYTKAGDGANNSFDLDPGADGVRGTFDDVRGDDQNLHWFRVDSNDPGQLPLPATIDSSTYSRDPADLPAGHLFAQNLDRNAAATMGHPSDGEIRTEAIMQQGAFSDEDQRELTADGVATIRLGMAGVDETHGTADDYALRLRYGGISSAATCDMSLRFSNMGGLAFCAPTTAAIDSPDGTIHRRLVTARMEYGVNFNWYFNQTPSPTIFADGFEYGGTLAWAATSP